MAKRKSSRKSAKSKRKQPAGSKKRRSAKPRKVTKATKAGISAKPKGSNNALVTAKWLRYIARTLLLLFIILIFTFALLSGAEQYGGGLYGILMNSPNALPWLVLLIFYLVAWKWELLGGIIITLLGLYAIGQFDLHESFLAFIIIGLPIILTGVFFIVAWWLTNKVVAKS